ncbi:MAG TPA: membrane protein insertase YidC [Tenuifilaceae bacterium]|nr:membrane protein insertase YidC [Tenuifilaceae bacterium]
MDRNTILGLVLIFLIMIGFGYLAAPSKEEREAYVRKADSLARVQAEYEQKRAEEEKAKAAMLADTIQKKEVQSQVGSFAPALEGERKFISLENDLMRVVVSNRGGRIYSVELKKFKTHAGEPLVLFNGDDNEFGLQFWGENNAVKTNDLFFVPQTSDTAVTTSESQPASLTMRLQIADSSYIDYIYTVKPNSYMVDFDIRFNGMTKSIGGQAGSIDLLWNLKLNRLEKGIENERNYTTIAYTFLNNDYEELNPRSQDEKKELTTKLKWVDFKHQFFSSILVANEHFINSDLKMTNLNDSLHVKAMDARLSLPFKNQNDETLKLGFYFGPNHYKTLKEYNQGFEKVVPLGRNIVRWINKYVIILLFYWLSSFLTNYGIIVLIMTIIIKLVLLPLTYKSYLSSAKMRVLKPQIDEISKKYPKKEDAMKKQQAVMALYKKVGVSPMGGCLPVLIQFPILIAMFRFFPASFELRQQSFLWAEDLSSYDSILHLPFTIPWFGDHISLFALLMAISMVITSKMSNDQMADTNAQMPGMKFMMTWLMPVMMMFWFNNYSAALSYYYLLTNLISMLQTVLMRRFVDDEALLAKLHENAKKPVTKSKWQMRMEEVAKRQQELQKRQDAVRKKR